MFSLTFLSSIRPGRNNPRAQRVVSLSRARKSQSWFTMAVAPYLRVQGRTCEPTPPSFPRQRNKIPRRLSFHAIMEREKKIERFRARRRLSGTKRERERERGSTRNMNTFTVIRLIFNTKQRAVRRWHIWSGSMARLLHRWLEICEKREREREREKREAGGGARLRGVPGREERKGWRRQGGGEGCLSVDVVRY